MGMQVLEKVDVVKLAEALGFSVFFAGNDPDEPARWHFEQSRSALQPLSGEPSKGFDTREEAARAAVFSMAVGLDALVDSAGFDGAVRS